MLINLSYDCYDVCLCLIVQGIGANFCRSNFYCEKKNNVQYSQLNVRSTDVKQKNASNPKRPSPRQVSGATCIP